MSLEALRKLRAQTVETLMMELAKITRTLAQCEERYQHLDAQIQQEVVTYERQSAQGLMIEAWVEWQGRMDSQQAALRRARREIDHAVEAWQQTKALLVEASLERKLLDVVADKRRDAQRADAARQEQRATDEAASRGYVTRRENQS
ncbi:MAG: flagellar export protein FliJ [Nitrospira sp.]|nr:flagellar export protein FliJ [Nitrospira sp.]